jgi:membrane-associated phospholipid phosphatase
MSATELTNRPDVGVISEIAAHATRGDGRLLARSTAPSTAPNEPVVAGALRGRVSIGRLAVWAVIAFVLSCAWDRAAWLAVSDGGQPVFKWLETAAPARYIYWPIYWYGRWVWLPIAILVIARAWLSPDPRRVMLGLRQGAFVLLAPVLAALMSELCKLITRRQRPGVSDGWYSFRAFTEEPLSASNLGLASSHASAAVAGSIALGILVPRWRAAFWILALACAMSRVVIGAHYLSDVVAGAILGLLAVSLYSTLDERNNPHQWVDGRSKSALSGVGGRA